MSLSFSASLDGLMTMTRPAFCNSLQPPCQNSSHVCEHDPTFTGQQVQRLAVHCTLSEWGTFHVAQISVVVSVQLLFVYCIYFVYHIYRNILFCCYHPPPPPLTSHPAMTCTNGKLRDTPPPTQHTLPTPTQEAKQKGGGLATAGQMLP